MVATSASFFFVGWQCLASDSTIIVDRLCAIIKNGTKRILYKEFRTELVNKIFFEMLKCEYRFPGYFLWLHSFISDDFFQEGKSYFYT